MDHSVGQWLRSA